MRLFILIFINLVNTCVFYGQNWPIIKDTVSPTIELTTEYDEAYKQPLSGMGWEDGVHISEDGLLLYCTYVPIDFLSFYINKSLPFEFSLNYDRQAPDYGIDLLSNPLSKSEWLHSDVLYSSRATLTDSFTTWQLSAMSRDFYSEGAPMPYFGTGSKPVEYMLFTSNDNPTNNLDIWSIANTDSNPSGAGAALPAPITTAYNEDNPHLVKLHEDTLILFYDSDNLPGGKGDIDLWYSISHDNGVTWNTPINVSTINTPSKEHQPFLFYDHEKERYYLYYAANHTDGKLAIFRKEQLVENNWDNWGNQELVISAGNAAGVGEPTLTTAGDMSFVVVYKDPILTSIYNQYDSDPWMLKRKNPIVTSAYKVMDEQDILVYPNPSKDWVYIKTTKRIRKVQLFNPSGQVLLEGEKKLFKVKEIHSGVYFLAITTELGYVVRKLVIEKK